LPNGARGRSVERGGGLCERRPCGGDFPVTLEGTWIMDALFFTLHSGLPHEGPGSRADTLRALAMTELAARHEGRLEVLDIGCGPGPASLVLLEALPEARVTAVDAHPPFLAQAEARLAAAGYGERFVAVAGDMAALPFAPGRFDLLWSEGAAYIAGVERALALWRPLLRPGGRLAFTDAVWLVDDPHPEARAVWTEYPEMTDTAGTRARIARAGWRAIGDFVISEAAWENYYGPLEARLAELVPLHGAEAPALAEAAREIALRRAHGGDYGYAFFVAEPG
jgi:SAM-dependent methyltransferase